MDDLLLALVRRFTMEIASLAHPAASLEHRPVLGGCGSGVAGTADRERFRAEIGDPPGSERGVRPAARSRALPAVRFRDRSRSFP
jgi:hypothetical protein